MKAAPSPVRRSAIFQPCAWCWERIANGTSQIHIREMPDLNVRIVHHLLEGDAECCATKDSCLDTLITDGVPAGQVKAAIEEIRARGNDRVTRLRQPTRRLKKARAK